MEKLCYWKMYVLMRVRRKRCRFIWTLRRFMWCICDGCFRYCSPCRSVNRRRYRQSKDCLCRSVISGRTWCISQGFDNPAKPMLAIVGGSKVSTKLDVLKSLAKTCDQIIWVVVFTIHSWQPIKVPMSVHPIWSRHGGNGEKHYARNPCIITWWSGRRQKITDWFWWFLGPR